MQRITLITCGLLAASCSTSPTIGTSRSSSADTSLVRSGQKPLRPDAGADQLADYAMANHPSLIAARHRANRLEAKTPQVASLPDPSLEISAGSMAETAAGRMQAMAGVKQKIIFPGKRRADAAAATSEAAAATAEVRALELEIREQVHAAWWDLYLASQTLTLTRENQSLLKAAQETIDARVSADQANQSDQIRLSNELAMADRDIAESSQLIETAKARLNQLLNRPANAPIANPGANTEAPTLSGTLEKMLSHTRSNHPEIAAAEKRVEAFRYRLRRAKLEKFPDLTAGIAGAAVSSSGLAPGANGRDQVFATIGINLPWWQEPRRAMIREAEAGIKETIAITDSKRATLQYRTQDAWFRAKSAREIADIFESRLIPDAKQAYEITLTGYSVGNRDFNDLIETWRQQLTYQLQLVRNKAQIGKAIATLKSAAAIR